MIYRGHHRAIATGIAIALPAGTMGLIAARSGLAYHHGIAVLGGVIDADYRGELQVLLANVGQRHVELRAGDRIAQLLVMPLAPVELLEVDALEATERGAGGLGSSGR